MKTFWNPKPPVWLGIWLTDFYRVMLHRAHLYSDERTAQILYSAASAATSLLWMYPITHLAYWLWRSYGPNNSHN